MREESSIPAIAMAILVHRLCGGVLASCLRVCAYAHSHALTEGEIRGRGGGGGVEEKRAGEREGGRDALNLSFHVFILIMSHDTYMSL
jgi:hypothetical protein